MTCAHSLVVSSYACSRIRQFNVFVLVTLIVCAWSVGTCAAKAKKKWVDIPLPVAKSEALKLKVSVNLANGARVFTGCSGCHDTGPTASNSVGPILNGIVGRTAAGLEDYDYSPAMSRAGKKGLVWTDYKLDAFLLAPGEFLKGNKMAFVGVKDEDARRDLIGYLKTLR